jgi:hypothetical protein
MKFILDLLRNNDAISWIKRSRTIGTGVGFPWRLKCEGLDDKSNICLIGFENKKKEGVLMMRFSMLKQLRC